MLNIIINNFEAPLLIFVNVKKDRKFYFEDKSKID